MKTEYLYELKEKLMKELKRYAEQEISASSLNNIDTLAHAAKNVCKLIEASEEGEYSNDGSYEGGSSGRRGRSNDGGSSSRRGRSYDGGSYEGSYDEGGSYRRRRDSMGRYSRAGMADKLRELMEDAPDERTREKLQQMISQMDQ